MKNFKKFLTLVLAVMMVVSSFAFSTSAATTKFEDIDPKDDALVEAVDLLAYMGITKGKSETNFGADEKVTREQFALFMYRFMKGGKDAPAGGNSTKFTDLEDPTYFYAISWAAAEGIVNGKSATTFAPKDGIKLQEAYAMIVRALDWEEENDLVYPFGHIEVAEQKDVELDENLDSNIGYTDELTRADMAILLYNAFFAETGIEETQTFIRLIEDDGAGDYDEFFFVEETYNPVFCVKHFDAIEVDYQAIATPNYAVEGEDATYDLGYDAIYFEDVAHNYYYNTEAEAPAYTYLTAEQIGVEADELNDYFLGEFKMYVTTDYDERTDSYEIDKVLYADCNMTKKSVSDLVLGEVSSNKEDSYYVDANGDQTVAKLLSGKITADGEDMYVFNAPYSYAKPSYNGYTTAYGKYIARNEKNLEGVSFYLDRDAEDDDVQVTVAAPYSLVSYPESDGNGDVADSYFTEQAEELVASFETAYYGGLHEADIYDVDGDGLYDYINYTPYRFFQVDSDEDESFEDSDFTGEDADHDFPYIYTTDATVIGEDFADEDYVIGYYAPDMDLVKIVAVVKPTVDTLDHFRPTAGTITLGNGDKVDVTGAYKLLANIAPIDVDGEVLGEVAFDAENQFENQILNCELFDNKLIDDEYEFYIYDGVLLYYGDVDNNYKFTENLIIPTDLYYEYTYYVDEDGELTDADADDAVEMEATTEDMNIFGNDDEIVRKPEEAFDAEAGKVWYIYAWVDGKKKYVPVVTEDVEPNLIVGGEIAPEYLNMLCTYSVDEDGVYTIKSLGYDVDDDDVDVYEGVNKDGLAGFSNADEFDGFAALNNTKKEDLQYYVDGLEGTIEKVAGSRFNIPGTGDGDKNNDGVFDRTVDVKSYTKIIIRVFDVEEQEFTYTVYDASSFKKSLDDGVVLTNMSYIVSNNPNSKNRENLVVLYAETTDVSFKGEADKDSYRIVSDYIGLDDEDGLWRYYYDLYDPFSGTKVEGVASVEGEKKASMLDEEDAYERGTIIELEDGMVSHKSKFDKGLVDNADLVYITEVDEAEGYFSVVNYNEVTGATYTASGVLDTGIECKDCIKDNVEDFNGDVYDFVTGDVIKDGNGNATTFIEYDKNTAVTVITRTGKFETINHWADGTMALSDMAAIADADKSLLCWNDWAKDRNGSYKKGYADYVKAYVSVVDEKLDEDELPVADFIIVIVNRDEPAALDAGEDYCGNDAH